LFAAFPVETTPLSHVGFGASVDVVANVPAQVVAFQLGEGKIMWYAQVA
jgi:hypothetical protein